MDSGTIEIIDGKFKFVPYPSDMDKLIASGSVKLGDKPKSKLAGLWNKAKRKIKNKIYQ